MIASSPEHSSGWPRAIAGAVILIYLALSIDRLSVFPAVGEDEPWIAAAPYKLATQGVYGSDLFTGYYGVDRHNYQHMPLYPLVQAGVFKVLGVGVLQMRSVPVAFGLALLLVVFLVGRELGDDRVGALAVVLMVALRLATGGEATGILLLDRARINRYDIAVPVFGLLALWAFNCGLRHNGARWWVATGVLTGFSSLSHLFGGFWLPVFVVLLLSGLQRRRRLRPIVLLTAGVVATWLPWVAYIATGWTDYLGQMRFVSARLDVLNPSFYLTNALHGQGALSWDWLIEVVTNLPLARPGAWTTLVGAPVAAAVMAWHGARAQQRNGGAAGGATLTCAFAALAQCAMFFALLQVKTINYMIGLWPLGALLLAWLGVWAWDRRRKAVRAGLVVLAALIVLEGATRIAHARTSARLASPYDWYTEEIARCIPPGSRVLGLQHYWLGLRQYEYRTWLVATNLAHPLYYDQPLSLDKALERIDPDIILIDRYMARFFAAAAQPTNPLHRLHTEYAEFVARHRVEPVCAVHNRTYGTMQVHTVRGPSGSSLAGRR